MISLNLEFSRQNSLLSAKKVHKTNDDIRILVGSGPIIKDQYIEMRVFFHALFSRFRFGRFLIFFF